jgi:membrane fusion protein (multidrug efflux system)
MYAKVRAAAEVRQNALLVPQEAVLETQGQYQVAIVGSDDKVTMRTVVVGQQAGGLQIIEKGVCPGERVITEGLQKVSDGMEVKLQSVRPEPALAESPTSADQAPSDAATPGSRS